VSEREIRIFGDPVLKTSCREVVELESVNQLVEDLLDTCSIPGRAGVAANQIGVDLRVFSYRVDGELGYLINPVITDFSEETELMEEGCLSVPSTSVGVKGSQLDGSEIAIQAEGLLAQVFQHECDHLDGVLYIDRLDKESKKTAMSEIRNSDWFL
jgi:peptide deformylase